MSRSIICFDCAKDHSFPGETATRHNFYPEDGSRETERFVWGNLNVSCVCDYCASPLRAGCDRVVAYTLETPEHPVRAWESEYLDLPPAPSTSSNG